MTRNDTFITRYSTNVDREGATLADAHKALLPFAKSLGLTGSLRAQSPGGQGLGDAPEAMLLEQGVDENKDKLYLMVEFAEIPGVVHNVGSLLFQLRDESEGYDQRINEFISDVYEEKIMADPANAQVTQAALLNAALFHLAGTEGLVVKAFDVLK